MSKDKAREFWIDNSKEKGDFFLYNVMRGVNNYNFEGAIHVIEYAAYAALEAKLAECVAALEAADFVLQGSRAIPGQSDKTLDKREAALWFFLETLAKVKK